MKRYLGISWLILGTFFATALQAIEPKNLSLIKQEIIHYHDSGEYSSEINKVMFKAKAYLKTHLTQKKHNNKKAAIVLDIDETALSNYPNLVKYNFGGTLAEIMATEIAGRDPVIKPTLDLYRYAKSHGIAVFFITGRYMYERGATVRNLKKAGYSNWDGLILRSKSNEKLPAWRFKKIARKSLIKRGYDIIVNIGDQKSDLIGGYAEKTFKLPNPFYYIN